MRFLVFLLVFSPFALADDSGLLRCRAVQDPAARLACYDALAVPAPTPRAVSPQVTSPRAAPAPTPEQFGLERPRFQDQIEAIASTIAGRFDGWGPNDRIRLANGQVWQVADGSSGAHWIENPKVRVRRGMLGAFFLEIEGTNRSPRVQRVQ
jgi:hypothetical protein